MIKQTLATLVATLSCAVPSLAGGTFEDHRYLMSAIHQVGVTANINDPEHCNEDGIDGVYYSSQSLIVICQDNATSYNSQVAWTANDLDTLRHEAHHLVQDCADYRRGDSRLIPLFEPDEFNTFVRDSIGNDRAKRLMLLYKEHGASYDDIVLEIEAFAVADSVNARSIADKVIEFCSVS